jgi:hypothetical protein
LRGGVLTTSCVAVELTKVAAARPMCTWVLESNPWPVMVIVVPPDTGTRTGLMPVTR